MDEERTSRTRLKVAGIAAAAVLAVPGGMAISNAVASDGGGAGTASPTYAPVQDPAPPEGERPDRSGTPGDRGDCPGKDGGGESGTSGTGFTQQ